MTIRTTPTVDLVALCPRYFEQVATLERQLFVDAWSLNSLDALWVTKDATGFGGWVAVDDHGNLLGYLITQQLDVAEVLRIATAPDAQGCGLASRLLTRWFDVLRSAKKEVTCLLEVRADNTAAISLYDKYGFKTIHRRIGYYANQHTSQDGSVDALIMQKVVNPD